MTDSEKQQDATASSGSDPAPSGHGPPAAASLPTWPSVQFPVSKFEAFDAATEKWGVHQQRL